MKLLAQVAVVAALSSTAFAQGGCTDPLLWDNGSPDGSGGYSNIIAMCGVGKQLVVSDHGAGIRVFGEQ